MILKKISINLIVAALAATIFLLPATGSVAAETKRVVIDIKNFKFAPRKPTLKVGDVVVWKNDDIVPHTATALDESWDSGTIEPGGTWQTTITAQMLTDYFCRFHPMMTAALTVQTNTAKR